MDVPDPTRRNPLPEERRVQFLAPWITSPPINVGAYSYYDDPNGAERFENENVLSHYGPERLIIGRFCAFATGVRFIYEALVAPGVRIGDVRRLQRIAWWDWPIDRITAAVDVLMAGDIAALEAFAR